MDAVNLDALRRFGDALATRDPERVMEAAGVDRRVPTFMIAVSEGDVSGCASEDRPGEVVKGPGTATTERPVVG
jgi:hypothetical protein